MTENNHSNMNRRLFLKLASSVASSIGLPPKLVTCAVDAPIEIVSFPEPLKTALKFLAKQQSNNSSSVDVDHYFMDRPMGIEYWLEPKKLQRSIINPEVNKLLDYLKEDIEKYCKRMRDTQMALDIFKKTVAGNEEALLDFAKQNDISSLIDKNAACISKGAEILLHILRNPSLTDNQKIEQLLNIVSGDEGILCLEDRKYKIKYDSKTPNHVIIKDMLEVLPFLAQYENAKILEASRWSREDVSARVPTHPKLDDFRFLCTQLGEYIEEYVPDPNNSSLVEACERQKEMSDNVAKIKKEFIRKFGVTPGLLSNLVDDRNKYGMDTFLIPDWARNENSERITDEKLIPSCVEHSLHNIFPFCQEILNSKHAQLYATHPEFVKDLFTKLPTFLDRIIPQMMKQYFPEYIEQHQAQQKPIEECKPEHIGSNIKWPGFDGPGNDIY